MSRPVTKISAGHNELSDGALEGWSRREFDAAEAGRLWRALTRARTDYVPQAQAAAEDAVFRFYLPLAKSLEAGFPAVGDPNGAEQAAELGLAQAILAWSGIDDEGFERFARGMITARLAKFAGSYVRGDQGADR